MVLHIDLKKLRSVPRCRSLNYQMRYLVVAVDAAYKKGRLAVFVLTVNIDPASNQEPRYGLSVVLACNVKQGGQLGIDNVWFGPGPFK